MTPGGRREHPEAQAADHDRATPEVGRSIRGGGATAEGPESGTHGRVAREGREEIMKCVDGCQCELLTSYHDHGFVMRVQHGRKSEAVREFDLIAGDDLTPAPEFGESPVVGWLREVHGYEGRR